MRTWQLTVIWIAALVLALGLFWVGLGQPYLASRALHEKPPPLVTEDDPRWDEIQARIATADPDWLTGAVAPAVILIGAMVLFTVVPRKD